MFSMLGASAMLPFLAMLPIQILVNNLLYDISQVSIPWDIMDEGFFVQPRKWDASAISKFKIYFGPISSLFFDYATFVVLWFDFKANAPDHQTLFRTGWFVESLLSQTLIVHMIRTRKLPFLQSWAAALVVLLPSVIMLIGIRLSFRPFDSSLKMQPLLLAFFPWLLGILCASCVLTQLIRDWSSINSINGFDNVR